MMCSFRQQLIAFLFTYLLVVCIVHSYRLGEHEHVESENNAVNEQAHLLALKQQLLTRRSLYDPAFGDSWSSYFEKKRNVFDPAYGEWANSFKRSAD